MYRKLAGMTGTADTEAYEFQQIYGLETVVIPTHMDMIREDRQDQVYRTAKEKYHAVIRDIKDCYERGQPVLVGTTSIENSELLSGLLGKDKLAHQVLNAKQHAREAEIVAQAGRPKMIHHRHQHGGPRHRHRARRQRREAVRADRPPSRTCRPRKRSCAPTSCAANGRRCQTRWSRRAACTSSAPSATSRGASTTSCAARSGPPGRSRQLALLTCRSRIRFSGSSPATASTGSMVMLKMPEGEAIEHAMVTRLDRERAEEGRGEELRIRKQLLEYDDVANDQRKEIYAHATRILDAKNVSAW